MFKTDPRTGTRYNKSSFDVESVELLLLLVTESGVDRKTILEWTTDQLLQAGDWAIREHMNAGDCGTRRAPKPEFIHAK